MAEAAQRWEKHRGQEPTHVALFVALGIAVRGQEGLWVVGHGGGDSEAEHLGEEQREDESDPGPEEGFDAGHGVGLVDGVIGRVARPAGCEAEDAGGEGEDATGFRGAGFHGDVDEGTGVGENSERDQEDDERWDPGVKFVVVDNSVAEAGDEEGPDGDDDDPSKTREVVVDRMKQLSTHYDIDAGPTDAGENVKDGNDLDPVPAEIEAGEDHLAEAKDGAEGAEEANRSDAQ